MLKTNILIFMLILSINTFGQSNKQISNFLNQIFNHETPLIYAEDDVLKSDKKYINSIINEDTLYSDSGDKYLILNDEEKKYLTNKILKFDEDFLSTVTLKNSIYKSKLEIQKLNKYYKSNNGVREKYGKSLYYFTKPIFIRDKSICLFYYYYGDNTYMNVYYKKDQIWKKEFTFYRSYY